MLWQIKKVLHCHFPDLQERLNSLPDPRKGIDYSMAELLMAAIVLFLLKCDSRNEFNHLSKDGQFCRNYRRMFRLRPPHMDAVNDLFEKLKPEELEYLRCRLVNALMEKRVCHKLRFFNKFFCIAVDGTGAYNWGAEPQDSIRQYALRKESKKSKKESEKSGKDTEKTSGKESEQESGSGTVSHSSQVLEAVMVCRNGMVIPLISEWIANDGEKYVKQDCELKAFRRLAARLKEYFPRLNVCILSDGLYTNVAMMDICRQYEWKFITVFKDGNLPSVWEEVEDSISFGDGADTCRLPVPDSTLRITHTYRWLKNIQYRKHSIHWLECIRETVHKNTKEKNTHRFVFLSNLDMDSQTVRDITAAGRARWSIEDHFNSQKNRGGALHHKFNRNDFRALKNWHNVRQMACMINELVEYTRELRLLLRKNTKMTLKKLWKDLNSLLTMCPVDDMNFEFENWSRDRRQVRLE